MATLVGKKNIYTCEVCGNHIVTVDIDEGTAPVYLTCRSTQDCRGWMVSHFYDVPQDIIPDWEWYKPSSTEGMNPGMKEHIEAGGLDLRKKP